MGIADRTGSGQSALLDILMGLLSPSSGTMHIDGVSLTANGRSRWRQRTDQVSQHIYLSDSSTTQNIALGVREDRIDMDRVRHAVCLAHISELIEPHRQGYDTRVGGRGVQLSGAQRQRIAIAGARYKQADVLVFGEASIALDSATETAVSTP